MQQRIKRRIIGVLAAIVIPLSAAFSCAPAAAVFAEITEPATEAASDTEPGGEDEPTDTSEDIPSGEDDETEPENPTGPTEPGEAGELPGDTEPTEPDPFTDPVQPSIPIAPAPLTPDPAEATEPTEPETADDPSDETSESEDADAPTYIEEDGWALAADYSELKAAVQAGASHIRLTADITMTGSLELKRDTVIDGSHEDGRGRWSISETTGRHTFQAAARNLTITVQNLRITGYDYYGFVSQRDKGAGGTGVAVIYQNVEYKGPQLAWLRYDGTLIIRDSSIELFENQGGNPAEELGEVTQLILGGKTEIVKAGGVQSLLWIYNEGTTGQKPGLLQVEDGADVRIHNPQTYLTYRETGGNGVSRYDVLIGDGATLRMHTNRGWCYEEARYIDTFVVGNGSTVILSRNYTDNMGYLYIKSALRVGVGSTLIVQDSVPIVYLGVGAVMECNSPELVRIDHGVTGNTPGELLLSGKTFNSWSSSAQRPDAAYNAPQGETVHITYRDGALSAAYVDEDTGEWVRPQVSGALLPMNTVRFQMGSYGLMIHPLTTSILEITGAVSPVTALSAAYFPRGADPGEPENRRVTEAVDAPVHDIPPLRGFRIDPGIPAGEPGAGAFAEEQDISFDLVRSIPVVRGDLAESVTPLYATEIHPLTDAGQLLIQSFPDALHFGARKIPAHKTLFPLIHAIEMVVLDTRADSAPGDWYLTVQSTALQNDAGDTLLPADALGYVENGVFQSLQSPVRIWGGGREPQRDEQVRTWAAGLTDNAFVVAVDPYRAQQEHYRAVVTWTLSVGI